MISLSICCWIDVGWVFDPLQHCEFRWFMRFQTWSRSLNPIQGKFGVCHCTSTMLNYRYLSSVLLILRNRRKPWDASGKKFVLVMLWDVPLVGLLSGLLNIIKSMCESTRHVICHDKSRVMFSLQRTHEYDRTPQHTALFVLAAHVFTPTYHISYCSLWKMGTTEVKSTVICMLTSRNYRYTIHRLMLVIHHHSNCWGYSSEFHEYSVERCAVQHCITWWTWWEIFRRIECE